MKKKRQSGGGDLQYLYLTKNLYLKYKKNFYKWVRTAKKFQVLKIGKNLEYPLYKTNIWRSVQTFKSLKNTNQKHNTIPLTWEPLQQQKEEGWQSRSKECEWRAIEKLKQQCFTLAHITLKNALSCTLMQQFPLLGKYPSELFP